MDLRGYQIHMELRFGQLIMECNLRTEMLRMGCYILVDKMRFIMSVFSDLLDIPFILTFFLDVVCSQLPVSIFSDPSHQYSHPSPPPAPPANQSLLHQWTVGAVYYSAIVLAEAFGKTNTSQIIDLGANGNNQLTPAYAIYEQGALSKVALINYMDDNRTGTNDLQVTIQVSSGLPQSVQVKYVFLFVFWCLDG